MNTKEIGFRLKNEFGLNYYPIGVYFADNVPEGAKRFTGKGNGCIVPLIFSSAKGKVVAIDKDSTGWNCSAFYLGYQDWIFEGIENFLSDGNVRGRTAERFVKTPGQAKEFVNSFVPEKINQKVTVFKPLEEFLDSEVPELVVFFANPDEMSGLIFLMHYNVPESDNLVVTGFNSGCGSIFTKPMKLIREGHRKAVWGMHDIAARLRLPADVMTLAMPYSMVAEMAANLDTSFMITECWGKIKKRNRDVVNISDDQ